MLIYFLIGMACAGLAVAGWSKLYPTPYPGIPYNEASAKRISGDIPDLIPVIKAKNEFSISVFTVTTRKLGTPIAQLLFPGIRKPLIVLEDPREIEDVLMRRNKEFDKAPMSIDLIGPMFPEGTISQYTTPKLRAQKRLWADVMSTEFLRKAAAPNIHKAALQLIELWALKSSTIYQDKAFHVYDDFLNSALDAIWVAVVGEEPGVTSYNIKKVQSQISGNDMNTEPLPRGLFLKKEIAYIGDMLAKNSESPVPKWAQRMETLTPRYRQFRRIVTTEITRTMRTAVERFERLQTGNLEVGDHDTCMMDMVLRKQVLEAKKTGKPMTDPTKDPAMIDELFTMLVGGHDSTANALTWFVRFLEAYPAVQTELRAALKTAFQTDRPSVDEILGTDIPYLQATCEESFRLAGVAKGNLRQALVDTEILGCQIPKGAEIFMNFHVDRSPVTVDPSRRGAGSLATIDKHGDGFLDKSGRDLATFEPRRYLTLNSDTGKEVFNHFALPSLAFGGGFRGCPGRKLATMEFRIIATLLVLNFEFLALPESLRAWSASERTFRRPDMPYARLRSI
ncbi:cytochrome P450 [Xylariaceae sp. FL1019]|nr:cytochrome P450 [Xylariaceae sp. FL1019]